MANYDLVDANNLITIAKAAEIAPPDLIAQVEFISRALATGNIVVITDVVKDETLNLGLDGKRGSRQSCRKIVYLSMRSLAI